MANGKGEFSIAAQMEDILTEFSGDLRDAVEKAGAGVSKAAANKLRSNSPRSAHHTRKYAEGWGMKKTGELEWTVHNKTNWQLTHLLENGHVIKNKKGTYGRAPAIKHIEPVEQWANEEFVNRIERSIK